MNLRVKEVARGREYCLFAEVPGIRGGVYEVRLASHPSEYELPFLALAFLDRLTGACRRLLASTTTTAASADLDEPDLHLRRTTDQQGLAVMWGRGVLAHVHGSVTPETELVRTALNAALEQLGAWRADVLATYTVESEEW